MKTPFENIIQELHNTSTESADENEHGSVDSHMSRELIEVKQALSIRWYMQLIGGLFIVVLGVSCNVMCIYVLSKPRMASLPSVFMMKVLAWTDLATVVISQGLILTLLFDGSPIQSEVWLCKGWSWLVAIFTYFSGYTIAGFSLDRCLAIALPLKYSMFAHKRKCLLGFLIINFILGMGFNSHILWFFDIGVISLENVYRCHEMHFDKAFFGWSSGPMISVALSVIIPELVIVICNSITIVSFLRHKELSKKMTAVGTKGTMKNEQVKDHYCKFIC